jgi:hypothetical protein
METEITARRPGMLQQQRELSQSLSKQKEILTLLTKCSLRRGAAVNPETLAIYAQDLSFYELSDIAEALEDLGLQPPQDFKQLWPAIGTILEVIRGQIRASRPSKDQRAQVQWKEHVARCKAEGSEELDVETKERIAALNAKLIGHTRP